MVEEGYQDVPSGVPWGSGGNVDCETPTSGSCDGQNVVVGHGGDE